MKKLLLIILFFVVTLITFSQPVDSSHHIPENKNLSASWKKSLYNNQRRVFKGEELLTVGMPCGGIAAGQLYVRGDGTLANWWIYNNAYNTGYGIDSLTHFNTALGPWTVCYKTFEPESYIAQGFAIKLKQNGKETVLNLNKKDFDDISFVGEYPVATVNYNSTSKKIPVTVSSEVYSPFIPMNAKESATPGTILKYTVKNTSSKPVQVSLSGWLQNFICLDIAGNILAARRNKIVHHNGITSLVMDMIPEEKTGTEKKPVIKMFDDFEDGYRKWAVAGNAFGNAPATGNFNSQSRLTGFNGKGVVNSYLNGDTSTGKMLSDSFIIKDDYIIFKIAGGRHAVTECFNLVINDSIVRTATGSNTEALEEKYWDVKDLNGKQARFEIVDADRGGWGHINLDDIGFSDMPVVKEKFYPLNHPYWGNASLSILSDNAFADADYKGINDSSKSDFAIMPAIDKLTGSVGESFNLPPGETKELTFFLTWYFPNRPSYYFGSDVTDIIPNDWNQALPAKGATVIGNMYCNWFNSSEDVALYLQKNYARLSQATHLFHDTYYNSTTVPYWLNQRLLMPLSTLATETCQWWANDRFWAWEGVGSCVGTCTHVWNYEQALAHFFPELERNIRERTDFDVSFQKDGSILARNGWGGVLIDGHAGAVLKAYREYLNSKDDIFLHRNWDRIKRAAQFIISEDGNEDGLIEKVQPNTYDIAFYGANTYVGSLYLAALKAAAGMAEVMNDTAFAQYCLKIAKAGEDNTVKRLWNGEYFIQDVNLKEHPDYQYAAGCLSDQLFGQTWNHLNNLGYIYPEEKVKQTLQSIWKYNWAPDVATQNKIYPPERTYANFGEAGLFVCTWPKNRHMGEKGVRYRDEVWTGIEYQVATNMIYEGMIDEALSIVKGIDERYSPQKHNPWNEIECGDHYARAMASWGVMLALEGYYYNGPNGIISFNPKIQPSHFKGFFTSAEAWGNIEQEHNGNQQKNAIELKYGSLSLQQIQLHCDKKPASIKMFINHKPVKNNYLYSNNMASIFFDEVLLQANDNVDVLISY